MSEYNRHNPANNYDRHLFRADRILQSAELNELQSNLLERVANMGNVLFKDGDLVRDAGCVVDATSGLVRLQSGALWLAGAVRGIAPAEFTIATLGTVALGVYLQEIVITELDDPALLNPAVGGRGYQEPGAHRLKVTPLWGHAGDGQSGQFYPVYEVVDGVLKGKEAPPAIDSVLVALQRYDRDSTGGSYIISGLGISRAADLAADTQVYVVNPGVARVYGKHVELTAALRHVYDAAPDLQQISDEPHVSSGPDAQRVAVDFAPLAELQSVSITAEKTVTLTHGVVAGSADLLPDSSVLQLVAVSQGGTVYTVGSDCKLQSGRVDWSPAGTEPAPGSSYTVTYQYIKQAAPTDIDAGGFTVTGAVAGTLILASYRFKLPRVDRLCLSAAGDIVPVRGTASAHMPVPPAVPGNMLLLATVYQRWTDAARVSVDAPRMVPMADLAAVQGQLDELRGLIAQQALQSDAMNRETALKKGVFVDPLLTDSMRDAGSVQSAAIVDGTLTLPIALAAANLADDVTAPALLPYSVETLIEQPRATGSMAVNPYQSFAPMPAVLELDPAVDQMTYPVETWASPLTKRIVQRLSYGSRAGAASSESISTVSSSRVADLVIRPRTVTFTLAGFEPGEIAESVAFDGIAVVPGTLDDIATRPVADADGKVQGKFNIPANVPVGRKLVQIVGSQGSCGSSYYTAASWQEDRILQRTVTEYAYEFDPPPAPPPVVHVPKSTISPQPYIPPATPSKPPADPTTAAVTAMYEKYLGRSPDAGGLSSWVGQVNSGLVGPALVEAFLAGAVPHGEPNLPAGRAVWEAAKAANAACRIDPLAQTVVMPRAAQLLGVDLWFEAVGPTDIIVQLRATENGLPTRKVLAHGRIAPGAVNTVGNATRVEFGVPYYAGANEELAFVVMCNDAVTKLAIAELGKFDGAAWVTSQAYTVGVLLSSSNDSTWTAHQDKDLRFALLAARYTASQRRIELGVTAVTDATDLMVLGLHETPGPHATIGYELTLPSGEVIAAAAHQPLSLSAPVSGDIRLAAILRGDTDVSPVLHRGGQLLVGWLGASGDYISRAVPAGPDSRVRVIVDALLPSGSGLTVQLRGGDIGDAWSAAVPQLSAQLLDNGWHELTFEQTAVTETTVAARIEMAGGAAARPFVRNIRLMVM